MIGKLTLCGRRETGFHTTFDFRAGGDPMLGITSSDVLWMK
jgi:hypothetical protein